MRIVHKGRLKVRLQLNDGAIALAGDLRFQRASIGQAKKRRVKSRLQRLPYRHFFASTHGRVAHRAEFDSGIMKLCGINAKFRSAGWLGTKRRERTAGIKCAIIIPNRVSGMGKWVRHVLVIELLDETCRRPRLRLRQTQLGGGAGHFKMKMGVFTIVVNLRDPDRQKMRNCQRKEGG